jgi:hypothetical protein
MAVRPAVCRLQTRQSPEELSAGYLQCAAGCPKVPVKCMLWHAKPDMDEVGVLSGLALVTVSASKPVNSEQPGTVG